MQGTEMQLTCLSATGQGRAIGEWDAPVPELTVGTDAGRQVRIHYHDEGDGRPVVLIHAWPFSSQIWDRQVPALTNAGYRVIAYDRRGFGRSSQPDGGYEYTTFTEDLAALISDLDLTDVTLVGYSMGGGEVVRYLSTHGSVRVRQAVLLSAAPPYMYKADDNPTGGMTDAMIAARQQAILSDQWGFLDEFTKVFFSTEAGGALVDESVREHYLEVAFAASSHATAACVKAFGTTDFRQDLTAVDVPVLILHGGADRNLPMEMTSKLSHQGIAGSEFTVIPGAPHGIAVTHADELNRKLLAFLATA